MNASLASSIVLGTTFSYDIGSATVGLRYLFLGASDASAHSVKIAAGAVGTSWTWTLPTAVPTVAKSVMTHDTAGVASFEHRSIGTVTSKTTADSPYTVVAADQLIIFNATAGVATINLPAAASFSGKIIEIVKTDSTAAGIITIDGNAAETIGGALTVTLNTQWEAYVLRCDGTNWQIVAHRTATPWTAYTPTGSFNNCTYTGFWRRVGDSISLRVKLLMSAAPGAASLNFSIPNVATWAIDTTKLCSTNAARLGHGTFVRATFIDIFPQYSSTTIIAAGYIDTSAAVPNWGTVTQAAPVAPVNTDSYEFTVLDLPIAGWVS